MQERQQCFFPSLSLVELEWTDWEAVARKPGRMRISAAAVLDKGTKQAAISTCGAADDWLKLGIGGAASACFFAEET